MDDMIYYALIVDFIETNWDAWVAHCGEDDEFAQQQVDALWKKVQEK